MAKIIIYTSMLDKTPISTLLFADTVPIMDESIGTQLSIVQVFSVSLPQVYEIKHLAMKSAFANICEWMCCSKELTEFECGTVRGCHSYKQVSCFLPSTINYKLYYCKAEVCQTTSSYRAGLPCILGTSRQRITAELQTSSHINSAKTVYQEFRGVGFNGWAAPVSVMCRWSSAFVHKLYAQIEIQRHSCFLVFLKGNQFCPKH